MERDEWNDRDFPIQEIENQETRRGRRSSILKPPRSPTRNVLSEYNQETKERRKSSINKRVSFADRFEVAVFDREISKDTEAFNENKPLTATSVLHTSYHHSDLEKQSIPCLSQAQPRSGEHVLLDSTKYFQEPMCDITANKSLPGCMEPEMQSQHNNTNNAVEDMSLTLTISIGPPADCNPCPTKNLSLEEKSFSNLNFTVDDHGLSRESIGVIRVDSIDKTAAFEPSFITNECADDVFGIPADNEQLEFCADADKRRQSILDVSMFCSPENVSDSDIACDIANPNTSKDNSNNFDPFPVFVAPEINRVKSTVGMSRVSTETLFLNESMALTTFANDVLTEVSPFDDPGHKTVNFSESMEIETEFLSENPILEAEKIHSYNGDVVATVAAPHEFSRSEEVKISPAACRNQDLLNREANHHNEPLETNFEGENMHVQINSGTCQQTFETICNQPVLPEDDKNDLSVLKSLQTLNGQFKHRQESSIVPIEPLPLIKDTISVVSSSPPKINPPPPPPPVRPIVQTNLKPKSVVGSSKFSFLTRKVGAIKLNPTQEASQKCIVNVRLNRWQETPVTTQTSPETEIPTPEEIQPAPTTATITNEEMVNIQADTFVSTTPKPSESSCRPQVLSADNVNPVTSQDVFTRKTTFNEQLSTALKTQAWLNSPSRIPVKCTEPTKRSPSNLAPALPHTQDKQSKAAIASDQQAADQLVSRKCSTLLESQNQSPLTLSVVKTRELASCVHLNAETCVPKIIVNEQEKLTRPCNNQADCLNGGTVAAIVQRHFSGSKRNPNQRTPRKLTINSAAKPTTPQNLSKIYTTPSKRRSVTRHSCIHSAGSSVQKKRLSTPRSLPHNPSSEKRPNVNKGSGVRNSFSFQSSLAQKHTITPISESRKPRSKRINCENLQSSAIIDESFPLVDGFSINSEMGNISTAHSIKLKSINSFAAASETLTKQPVQKSIVHSNLVSVERNKSAVDIPIKSTFQTSNEYVNQETSGPASSGCHDLRPSSTDAVITLTQNRNQPTTMNSSDASPLLSTRKQDVSQNSTPESCKEMPPDPRKSLQEDFEHDSPTKALPTAAAHWNLKNGIELDDPKYCTFTRPNDQPSLYFSPEVGLEEELDKLMKSELVAEDWKYKMALRTEDLVYFYYAMDVFYLNVRFENMDLVDGSSKLGRGMRDIKVTVKDTVFAAKRPENPLVLKNIHHHLKNVNLENYKFSSTLPELLMKVTDAFFRGQSLKRDLFMLTTYMDKPMNCSEDGVSFEVGLLNLHLEVEVCLSFSVNFETYPFAALRPGFKDIDNGLEFKSDIMEAMRNEKPGELYLWRMYQAAQHVLKREEKIRPPIERVPFDHNLFVKRTK